MRFHQRAMTAITVSVVWAITLPLGSLQRQEDARSLFAWLTLRGAAWAWVDEISEMATEASGAESIEWSERPILQSIWSDAVGTLCAHAGQESARLGSLRGAWPVQEDLDVSFEAVYLSGSGGIEYLGDLHSDGDLGCTSGPGSS